MQYHVYPSSLYEILWISALLIPISEQVKGGKSTVRRNAWTRMFFF